MASSLNRATLIGNLTRDPELRKIPSGQSVASFSIATNRVYTDSTGAKKEQADYHNIVAWGRLGEICAQYLSKGKKVYIDGRLQTREWEAADGQKRQRTEIVAENMVLLDRPPVGGAGSTMARPAVAAASPAPVMEESPVAPEEEIKLEDIPF